MNFEALAASLPAKKAAVYTFERGEITRHPYAMLEHDIARAEENLRRWGVVSGSRVGIFAPNCYFWLVYDFAMIGMGVISVPFTNDFAGQLDRGLLDKYQVTLLLISKSSPVAQKQPWMAYIDVDGDAATAIPRPPDENSDALTMAFSSGSAGGLKGLLVSRSGMEATLPPIVEAFGVRPDDKLLLFMPISNFQQRTLYYSSIWSDCDIVITDYTQLPAALKQTQPTILIAPPMYYQTIYTRFVNFARRKKAFWQAAARILSWLPTPLRRRLAAGLFREFYQQFGGKMRVLATGMAPMKYDVAKFFSLMQLPLCESYGLMETGSLTWRAANSRKYGSVGKPLRGITLEFTDEGEIIVNREKTLTTRYFQSAEGENEHTFIGPGRIATGDIGKLDADGYLYLLGRKKELIITSGGYKIHPEIVESELAGCPDVAQAAVFLKRGTASLVCVVAPNQPEAAGARDRINNFVRTMKTTKAAPIAEVVFSSTMFSIENGMLRPNLKLDRRTIAAKFNLA